MHPSPARNRSASAAWCRGSASGPLSIAWPTTMDLTGWVLNHSGGVEIEVEGPPPALEAFVHDLTAQAPPLARIVAVEVDRGAASAAMTAFEIRHSVAQEGRYQLISPDIATCADCLRELLDPADRRYRYPFTNCTNCGPRFTIIRDIPYDRPLTTMQPFRHVPRLPARVRRPARPALSRPAQRLPGLRPARLARRDRQRRARHLAASGTRPLRQAGRAAAGRARSWPSRAWAAFTWPATRPTPRPCRRCASARAARPSPLR